MNQPQDVIDKAVKEQYPDGKVPGFLQSNAQQIQKKSEKDRWTDYFDSQLKNNGLVAQPEFRFHPERMWRFDRAFPNKRIAVEIDGGGFGRVVICGRCKQPVMRLRKDGVPYAVRE